MFPTATFIGRLLAPFAIGAGLWACSGLDTQPSAQSVFPTELEIEAQQARAIDGVLSGETLPPSYVPKKQTDRAAEPAPAPLSPINAQPPPPAANLPATPAATSDAFSLVADSYRLAAGDIVSVRIADGQSLLAAASQTYTLDASGGLDLGDWGAYRVAGLTTLGVQNTLLEALRPVLTNPIVAVNLLQSSIRPIVIGGDVHAPGGYRLEGAQPTLADLIARAGSLLRTADISRIRIERDGQSNILNLRQLYEQGVRPQAIALRAGDVVFIPRKTTP